MPVNPYEPPKGEPERKSRGIFWIAFAVVAAITLSIDSILLPYMHYDNPERPETAWMLVNLPGLPVAIFTARRGDGEPLRFLLKSATIAALHWGTFAGLISMAILRSRPLSHRELWLLIALNTLLPWMIVQLLACYEWGSP